LDTNRFDTVNRGPENAPVLSVRELAASLPRRWVLVGLTLLTFFFSLGGRSLNEPDEGRYAEIAREMLERGDWVVPHLWYAPHLDKPPVTYWMVAASMKLFGQNGWAVRLPLALAGISGVAVAWLFARSLAGARAGFWAAMILQSSLLYFAMARMLTTDILLTQFIAWAGWLLWRAWRALQDPPATTAEAGRQRLTRFLGCICGAAAAMGLGFLTKGPIALAVPMAALLALAWYGRGVTPRWRLLALGAMAGLAVFALVVAPWFALVWQRVPGAFDYMAFGQAVGHALGTAIKNRRGHPLYFVGILAVGFLPWTLLVGFLWRRAVWRNLSVLERQAWLFLSVWALVTFTIFSFSRAKLPAYILPMFPPLAILVVIRWFGAGGVHGSSAAPSGLPPWAWRACLMSAALGMVAAPVAIWFVFKPQAAGWLLGYGTFGALVTGLAACRLRTITAPGCFRAATLLALINLALFSLAVPSFETALRHNQTLKPIGRALRDGYRPDDVVICWGRFPQGLPFYAAPVLSATNRPYLGGLDLTQVPFESAGNRQRFEPWVLPDEAALVRWLTGRRRVWLVAAHGFAESLQQREARVTLRLVLRCGYWDLFSNR
jgi:4-amino-4-deoxy-L-arabinose transferase-like glycosyltransferase